jgi:hypothetical protein
MYLAMNSASLVAAGAGGICFVDPCSATSRFNHIFCADAPRSYQAYRVCCEILVNVRGQAEEVAPCR